MASPGGTEKADAGKAVPASGEKRPRADEGKTASATPARYTFQCELKGHERAVSSVKFAPAKAKPDGNTRLLASTSADSTVKIWKVHRDEHGNWGNPELYRNLTGHASGCNDVCWAPNGEHICTASDDKTLKVWNVETGECAFTLEGHTNYVMCCNWQTRGNLIVSGSFDETVRVWDVTSRKCQQELPAHSDPVTSTYFNKDGSMIVSCSYDGLCRIWNTETGSCLQSLVDSRNPPVSHVCWTPNGKYLLASALDGRLRLWDYQNKRKVIKRYDGHKNEQFCLFAGFAQGSYVVSGSEDNTIHLWDLNSRDPVQIIAAGDDNTPGHKDIVLCCHAEDDLLASGSMDDDPRILIWRDLEPKKSDKKKKAKRAPSSSAPKA